MRRTGEDREDNRYGEERRVRRRGLSREDMIEEKGNRRRETVGGENMIRDRRRGREGKRWR